MSTDTCFYFHLHILTVSLSALLSAIFFFHLC